MTMTNAADGASAHSFFLRGASDNMASVTPPLELELPDFELRWRNIWGHARTAELVQSCKNHTATA